MSEITFFIDLFRSGVRLGTPLALAGVGGAYAERSGVFNIGIEGMMLSGAFTSVIVSYFTGNPILGVLAAILTGGLMGFCLAYLCITKRLEQIVCGLAINLIALGATNVLYKIIFGPQAYDRVNGFTDLKVPLVSGLPVFGELFFSYPFLTYVAVGLAILGSWVMYKTKFGLTVRAVGDNPMAVDVAGISVTRVRYQSVIISGMAAGLGGAALALNDLRYFIPNMTAGRGFIVIAAHFCGKWRPIQVAMFCLIFGIADSLQLRLQAIGIELPAQILSMTPYLLTIIFLAGLITNVKPPKMLDIPYIRGQR
jgi:simple sugar transport system permease protein